MDGNQMGYYQQNADADNKIAEKKRRKREIIIFILGMIAGSLVTIWVYIGVSYYRYNKAISDLQQTTSTAGEEGKKVNTNETIVNSTVTTKMKTVEQLIRRNYYKEVDEKTLEDGLFEGMMSSLGDPYSEYYSEEELEEFRQDSQGIYYGIGAYISTDPETKLVIISGIISGTPAEEAGIQTGDIIYKVDDQDTSGMSTSEVVSLIKGEEGTVVHITFIRDGEVIEKDVTRRKVEAPTVNYEMREGNIGYIQITEFDDVTTDQFIEAKAVLEGQGMEGLIIDLRSNGGGNLTTCCDIARQLLPQGLIVYTEDKYGKREEFKCDGTREFDKPLVVLVNGYSASASEILTGAIKDYGKGTIMGTNTYGKGIVQQIMSLYDGTAVKMTISKYYTPNGNYIHEIGIAPDIEVEFDSENYEKGVYDNQIEAAEKEIMRQLGK